MSKSRKIDVSSPDEAIAELPRAAAPNGGDTPNGVLVSAMIDFGKCYNEGVSALGREMLDFSRVRLSRDLDFSRVRLSRDAVAAQSLAHCKDWSEAIKIQQAWVQATTEEYVAELGKVFQLAMKATVDSYRPLQDQAEAAWRATNGGQPVHGA